MAASATKRWLATSLKAAVAVSLIWLVLRGVDLEEAARYLHALSFGSLALVLALLALQGAIGAWR